MVSSSQRRNNDGFCQASSAANKSADRRISENHARAVIEFVFNGQQVLRGVLGQADPLGEVLA
jgi:hypothetical protein